MWSASIWGRWRPDRHLRGRAHGAPDGPVETALRIVGDGLHDLVRQVAVREPQTAGVYQVIHLERLELGTSMSPFRRGSPRSSGSCSGDGPIPSLRPSGMASIRGTRRSTLAIDQTGAGRPVFNLFVEAGLDPLGITITGGDTSPGSTSTKCMSPSASL